MSAYMVWFLIGLGFIVAELAVPGFILIFFGIGCWVTALFTGFLFLRIEFQIGLFIISSLASLLILRRYWMNIFSGKEGDRESDGFDEDDKGKTAVVTESILPNRPGQIKYRGSFWKAVSDVPIDLNTMVVIEGPAGTEGLMYKVKSLENGEHNAE